MHAQNCYSRQTRTVMSQADHPKKILVIRNDKIGDFMLAWPSFALLKAQYPQAEITTLVPHYTAPLAEQCEWIDKILIDEKKSGFLSDVINLSKNIRQKNYDLSISLFSESRTSLSLWLAGVKLRIGPATKIAQIFLNRRLRQKRSRSAKPEYEYNLDLIKYYIRLNNDTPIETPPPPYLKFKNIEITSLRDELEKSHHISNARKIVIIHPGTGGSAINLSIEQYAELIKQLSALSKLFFIITAGPGELARASELSGKIPAISHAIYESKEGIINFSKLINTADLYISGSTGPLHIAGALDVPTVAFYPSKKSASPVRWQTLNAPARRLAITDTSHADESTFKIDTSQSSKMVFKKFLTST